MVKPCPGLKLSKLLFFFYKAVLWTFQITGIHVQVKDYQKHLVLPAFSCKIQATGKSKYKARVFLCNIFWKKWGFIIQLWRSQDSCGWLRSKAVEEVHTEKMLKYLDFLMKTFLSNTVGIPVQKTRSKCVFFLEHITAIPHRYCTHHQLFIKQYD